MGLRKALLHSKFKWLSKYLKEEAPEQEKYLATSIRLAPKSREK